MKTAKSCVNETIVVTPNEKELILQLASQAMYQDKKHNTNLRFHLVDENHFQIFNDAEKAGESSKLVIEGKFSPADKAWGGSNFFLKMNYSELNIDPAKMRPITNDWYSAFHGLIDRANIASQAEGSSLVPASSPKLAFEILNKSYYVYQDMETFKGADGKTYRRPGKSIIKLTTGVKVDEKMLDMIQTIPKTNLWLVIGSSEDMEDSSFMNFANTDELEKRLGVKSTDIAKMWDLIECRKITPIFQIMGNPQEDIRTSMVIVESVLIENQINPKFSKSNLII